ncbi:MAG TPA: hypothetical protein VG096_15245 [Bryobacteraceae bacterium]|jgi:hypothetical protein|nr:hypothetical protein [Bryobacteraceae bacterium]
MADRISYRKLPGRRRGFLRGASVWLAPDHLLLVNSMRFREEYKRYQLRDIQGIAVARCVRFHLSTRALVIAILWLLPWMFFPLFPSATVPLVLALVGLILALAWLYISIKCSCTCRIYTAVSRDELPSVYRTWVADRFLRAVEPEIAAVQGALESESAEANSVEANQYAAPQQTAPPEASLPQFDPEPAPAAAAPVEATAFYFLLAALLLDAAMHGLLLYYSVVGTPRLSNLMALLVIAAAVWVLVQYHRGKVRPAQQKLAIAALVGMGLMYYIRITVIAGLAGVRAAIEKKSAVLDYTGGPVSAKIEMGVTLLLGLVGLVILLAGRDPSREPPSISS